MNITISIGSSKEGLMGASLEEILSKPTITKKPKKKAKKTALRATLDAMMKKPKYTTETV